MCARWLSRELTPGNEPLFVLADARHMPFAPESFGGVFSYSCIQHFSKQHAEIILSEMSRVMKVQAKAVIQTVHSRGIRSTVTLVFPRELSSTYATMRYRIFFSCWKVG